MSQITKYLLGSSNPIDTLTGNSGGAVGPTAGNINIVGAGSISVSGNPGTSTLTISDSSGSGITLTGDSGGALGPSNSFTLTGANTGLTFSGSGTTLSIAGTLHAAYGGTGNSGLTNHAVLVGAGNSPVTQLTPATDGQLLIGSTGFDPSFQSLTSFNNTITYIAGGSSLNLDLTAPVHVIYGGTGATTLTGVLIGNGTSAITGNAVTQFDVLVGGASNAIVSITNGTTGQLLMANTGANPSWENVPASSISITGDSGGALTSGSFTFTGGSTGLLFSGAGTTETLTGTVAIAHGGTNATSFSTSNGIVKYNGTSLVSSTTATIDGSNRFKNTAQPAFQAYQSTSPSNVTGNGTVYIIAADTVLFDQAGNYNNSTYTFTAPVSGRYFFNMAASLNNVVAQTTYFIQVITSGNTFNLAYTSGINVVGANGHLQLSGCTFCNMASGDIANFVVVAAGSTQTCGINGDVSDTFIGGYLVC